MSLTPENIRDLAINAVEDMKAKDVVCLDVKPLTSIADYMIVCSGTSNRHLYAIAQQVVEDSKQAGLPNLGVEGDKGADWILVDLADVIVHIMLPDTRTFYDLEKLWSITPNDGTSHDGTPHDRA